MRHTTPEWHSRYDRIIQQGFVWDLADLASPLRRKFVARTSTSGQLSRGARAAYATQKRLSRKVVA